MIFAFVLGLVPWLLVSHTMYHVRHCRRCKEKFIQSLRDHENMIEGCTIEAKF